MQVGAKKVKFNRRLALWIKSKIAEQNSLAIFLEGPLLAIIITSIRMKERLVCSKLQVKE